MKTPTLDEMQQMFRAHTEAAVKVIVDIMTNATGAKGEATRLAAAKEVLNRGWGRATTYKGKDAPREDTWRSRDGKTYAEVYAEKAAEVAAQQAAARAAAAEAPPPQSATPATEHAARPAPPAAVPVLPPVAPHPDPTGYIARRALFSGPAAAAAGAPRLPAGR